MCIRKGKGTVRKNNIYKYHNNIKTINTNINNNTINPIRGMLDIEFQ